jgi:hypothetical protein
MRGCEDSQGVFDGGGSVGFRKSSENAFAAIHRITM